MPAARAVKIDYYCVSTPLHFCFWNCLTFWRIRTLDGHLNSVAIFKMGSLIYFDHAVVHVGCFPTVWTS